MINLQSTPTNAIILLMDVQQNGTTAKLDMNVTITICLIIHMEIYRFAEMKYLPWQVKQVIKTLGFFAVPVEILF